MIINTSNKYSDISKLIISFIKIIDIYAICNPVVNLPRKFGKGVSVSIKDIWIAAPSKMAISLEIKIINI